MNRNTSTSSRDKSILIGLAAALAMSASLAVAAPAPREELVPFERLAQSSLVAQQAMTRRIENAARRVCAPLESRMLAVHRSWLNCVEVAVREAQDELVLAGAVRLRDDSELSLGEE